MNKNQLLTAISELLEDAIEVHETTDLCLEETDTGALLTMNILMENAIDALRRARRVGRVILEKYEDDLTKKDEYIDLDDSIEDEDEDED